MQTLETINKRRSLRDFVEGKTVEKKDIETILRAAMQAPSAYNQQPWNFVVIENREILDELSEKHPHAKMLKNAPCAILVCGNKDKIKSANFRPQDCAATSQNILLAIAELNLGGVWCGVYPKQDLIDMISNIVSLDENLVPFSLIAVGHPIRENIFMDRYQEDRIIWK